MKRLKVYMLVAAPLVAVAAICGATSIVCI